MILIVGLGNPGDQYEKTRHNTGFMILDRLKESFGFPEFELSKKHNGVVSQGKIFGKDIVLLKPQTFMNESGKAVKAVAKFFRIRPEDIYVVQDEADVDLGKIKVSFGTTSAGHKGAQSIIDEMGTNKFTRFRVGIDSSDPAYEKAVKRDGLENVVLKNFTADEEITFEEAADKAVELITSTIRENGI